MGLNWLWCGICAKYLTFGTYPTSTVGALSLHHVGVVQNFFKIVVLVKRFQNLRVCLVIAFSSYFLFLKIIFYF